MGWLPVPALGIMWAALLLAGRPRKASDPESVHEFERGMELLAQTEVQTTSGRWIVTPLKGARFVGTARRRRIRARQRRRQVFTFLLEAIGISFLIGLVPPLRVMWTITVGLAGVLVLYVWLLVAIKHRSSAEPPHLQARDARTPARPSAAAPIARYAAEGSSARARPVFNGLGALGEGDRVHVVVRTGAEMARA